MSRSPETKTRRHPFDTEEDALLMTLVAQNPFRGWDAIAREFENRTARQCRERWLNYLCPRVQVAPWTPQEDEFLVEMVSRFGRSWSAISRAFRGRSENDIKNRWHSHLRHRIAFDGMRCVLGGGPDRRKRRRPLVDAKRNAMQLLDAMAAEGSGEAEVGNGPPGVGDELETIDNWPTFGPEVLEATGFGELE
jgi:hypothetical protein